MTYYTDEYVQSLESRLDQLNEERSGIAAILGLATHTSHEPLLPHVQALVDKANFPYWHIVWQERQCDGNLMVEEFQDVEKAKERAKQLFEEDNNRYIVAFNSKAIVRYAVDARLHQKDGTDVGTHTKCE